MRRPGWASTRRRREGELLALPGYTAAIARAPASDLEVVALVENLDFESTNDPDDLLGHGLMTARLRVQRVLRGKMATPTITVRYFGHTFLDESKPICLRLKHQQDGGYVVCAPAGGTGFRCP